MVLVVPLAAYDERSAGDELSRIGGLADLVRIGPERSPLCEGGDPRLGLRQGEQASLSELLSGCLRAPL